MLLNRASGATTAALRTAGGNGVEPATTPLPTIAATVATSSMTMQSDEPSAPPPSSSARALIKRARSFDDDEDRVASEQSRNGTRQVTAAPCSTIAVRHTLPCVGETAPCVEPKTPPLRSNVNNAQEGNATATTMSNDKNYESALGRGASGMRNNRDARFQDRCMSNTFHELLGPYEEPDEAKDVEEMGEGYADFDDLPVPRQEALMQSVRKFAAHIANYEHAHLRSSSNNDNSSNNSHTDTSKPTGVVNNSTSTVVTYSKRQQKKMLTNGSSINNSSCSSKTAQDAMEQGSVAGNNTPVSIPPAELEHWRVKASRLPGLKDTARKSELTAAYRQLVRRGELAPSTTLEHCLIRKRGKSHSGVLVVTVFMGPGQFSCPKDCHYCPAQPGVARSYLLKEPGVLRGFRNGWDPIRQFYDRASALECNGHVVDKVELIILGGTFSFYPVAYVEEFMTASFYAANTFYDSAPLRAMGDLSSEIAANESEARCRIIGVTIETRPDYIHVHELRRLRRLGVTRVQLGIQHLDDDILDVINRDCPTVKTVRAIRLLLDAGFKVDAHWMPDLPGSSYARDREMFELLFSPENESFQVDQWKVYPTATVPYTRISEWYREGRYTPYAETDGGKHMVELLLYIMQHCPERIRLNRIIRDIPTTYIMAGERRCNLRQILEHEMRARHITCRDIRARECKGEAIDPTQTRLYVDEFRASEGTELYLSVENTTRTQLYGHLRLRLRDRSRCPHCTPIATSVWEDEETTDETAAAAAAVPDDCPTRAQRHCTDTPPMATATTTIRWCRPNAPNIASRPRVDGIDADTTLRTDTIDATGDVYTEDVAASTHEAHGLCTRDSVMAPRCSDDAEPALSIVPALRGCALIRELHTYGRLVAVHCANTGDATQHTGVGTRLVRLAERIARRRGYHAVAIIAGVGVRRYYARLGYHLEDTYMVRRLDLCHVSLPPSVARAEGCPERVSCSAARDAVAAETRDGGTGGVMTRLRSWMGLFGSRS